MDRDMYRDTKSGTKSGTRQPLRRAPAGALTDAAIRRLRPGQKRVDGALEGGHGRLIVRVRRTAGGVVREFAFRWYDTDEAERALTLGAFPALPLTAARARARELIAVRAKGGDPAVYVEHQAVEREATDRAKREAGTFGELLDAYVAGLRAEGKRSALQVEKTLKRHVRDEFPKLIRRKAGDITPHDVRDIVARLIGKGVTRTANLLRAYLHAAFARAVQSDLNPRRTAAGGSPFNLASNPAANVPRQADFDRVGDRVLTDEELRAYYLAVKDREDPIGRALALALLLGGQRIAQTLRLTWADFDREAGTLRLRDPKGRGGARDHVLPTSPSIIARIPLPHPDGGEYLLTTGRQLPIHESTLSAEVTAIAKGIVKRGPSFTARDIRRTVETRLAALGVSKDLRAQVLSHGLHRDVQAKHYDRHMYLDEKRGVLELWHQHLRDLPAKPPKPAAKGRAKLRLVA